MYDTLPTVLNLAAAGDIDLASASDMVTDAMSALGILVNNGIKGAEGGTHLRNIILSLQNPTDKAADAMESLGFQVYDSQGNMRSMNDIWETLINLWMG